MIKSFLTLMLLAIISAGLHAQCYYAPSCVGNGDLYSVDAGVNMNDPTNTNATMANWCVSHGTPSIAADNAPGSTGHSVWMWSYGGIGEGIYTCFNFQSGHTYHVCLWVKNTNTINLGHLKVYAANGLSCVTPYVYPGSYPGSAPPTPSSSQLIDSSFTNDTSWTHLMYTFTASGSFTQLWIYPFMGNGPIDNQQYELEVDGIRVSEGNDFTPVISASKDTLSGCNDSTTLSVSGVPSGYTVTWTPATGLSSAYGTTVVAKPCHTTTYTVDVSYSGCPSCYSTSASYTIYVNEPVQPAYVYGPMGPVNCEDSFILYYSPQAPCGATYTWLAPNGDTISTSDTAIVHSANTANSGMYTVVVHFPNGCSYSVQSQPVMVVGCCDVAADFKVIGCDSISFMDATTATGTILNWYWDFGDGNTSTLQNPSHTYAAAGSYTVCLAVTASYGPHICYDTICKKVKACPAPCDAKPNFKYKPSPPPATPHSIDFTDASSFTGSFICNYKWDFGDGNTSNLQNPTHVYASAGVYMVCLTIDVCVVDGAGNIVKTCSDQYCQKIDVGGERSKAAGINNIQDNLPASVSVIPNPATDEIHLEVEGITNPVVMLRDITGKTIGMAEITTDKQYFYNIQRLPKGTYFVEVKGTNAAKTVQFIKN